MEPENIGGESINLSRIYEHRVATTKTLRVCDWRVGGCALACSWRASAVTGVHWHADAVTGVVGMYGSDCLCKNPGIL
jgi:hypothetical protein